MNNKPSKTGRLRELINSPKLDFLMEAHNGLSSKIVEEAGFDGIWASGLSISASHGVRDNNELSWTQVLETLEFMNDAVAIPILVDGDTGYGNFNNLRRAVSKLESHGIAGICIEDKLFPKSNSFIDGERQPLADLDEFCGKIKAGKDTQHDPHFSIVARVEAFIAGWGLGEALKRAEAYRAAGADAILIHSKKSGPEEILAFKKEWANRSPVLIVPTKYYDTPTDVFEAAGFSVVIWANHLVRSAIVAMQETARTIKRERALVNIEGRIAPITEIFRLQGAEELKGAEKRYLPEKGRTVSGLILAASRGSELGDLTVDRPKALVPIAGKPLLDRLTDVLNAAGVKDITVVRGFKKEAFTAPSLKFVDNDEHESTHVVYSLNKGLQGMTGTVLVSYGDILFDKYIPMSLIDNDNEFCIVVDPAWKASANLGRYMELVEADRPYSRYDFGGGIKLRQMNPALAEAGAATGEWMGLWKVSAKGLEILRGILNKLEHDTAFKTMRMSDLFNLLVKEGHDIHVLYSRGRWFDVDEIEDVRDAGAFVAHQP